MEEFLNGQGRPAFKAGDRVRVRQAYWHNALLRKFGTTHGRVAGVEDGVYHISMGREIWVVKTAQADLVLCPDTEKKGHITFKFT